MADDKVALEIFIEADKAEMTLGDLEAGFDSINISNATLSSAILSKF